MFENKWAKNDNSAQMELPEGTFNIYEGIDKDFNTGELDSNVNRGSAANGCVRQRWYKKNGYEAKGMAPRAYINFGLGDASEHIIKYYISRYCVGPGKLYKQVYFGKECGEFTIQHRSIKKHEQLESSWKYLDDNQEEQEVVCHFDGLGQLQDGTIELIEIKSASSFGFTTFKKEGPEDYLNQAHSYMMTDLCVEKKVKRVRFFYIRKETGHIFDRQFPYNVALALEVKRGYYDATRKEPPRQLSLVDVKYRGKPTGKKKLSWKCEYCPYIEVCRPEYEVSYTKDRFGNQKPVYTKIGE